jgi:hypothetical protein
VVNYIYLANIWNQTIFLVSSAYPKHKNPKSKKKWGFTIQPWQSPQGLPFGLNEKELFFSTRFDI